MANETKEESTYWSTHQFKTLDSGKRVDFPSGSRRDTQDGKPRYDLVGLHGLRRLAELYARGAEKYGEHNWEKGYSVARSYASAFRHLVQYAMGERTEDHLAAVAFNVFAIMHVEEENKRGRAGFQELLDLEIYQTPHIVADLSKTLPEKVVYIIDNWKQFMDGPASYDGIIFGEIMRGIHRHFGSASDPYMVHEILDDLENNDPRLIVTVTPQKTKYYSYIPF